MQRDLLEILKLKIWMIRVFSLKFRKMFKLLKIKLESKKVISNFWDHENVFAKSYNRKNDFISKYL